jgi:hypothetical protein
MATILVPRIKYGRKLIARAVCDARTRQYLVTSERVMAVCSRHLSDDRTGRPELAPHLSSDQRRNLRCRTPRWHHIRAAGRPLRFDDAVDDGSLQRWLGKDSESSETSEHGLQAAVGKALGNA